MKKTGFILTASLFLCISFALMSCSQKEKAAEKQVIQISDQDLQEKNTAVYRIREVRGRTRTYLSLDFSGIEKPSSLEELVHKDAVADLLAKF